ncbi:TIGR03943 family protein [Microcoleus sp. FACHB-1515]|uniref:TIGR03943 family putative permease subunit n=1 Tax=Cyanophyceae TaxID=3028117 RepID=UPI001689FDFF|nr:TIGR03943 family protein [Microcoleus sp. FACHB-1515]MBD2093212.1 TIGR03943 family protein [Microcoleus sp. FACHB-1515]
MTTQSLKSFKLSRSKVLTNWLTIVAITAWGLLMFKYRLTGELALLVHPRFFGIVVGTGLALLVISGVKTRQLLQRRSFPTAPHTTSLPAGFASGLLAATALLGLLTAPQVLGSAAATQQGITEALISTRIQPQAFRGTVNSEERTILQWARTLTVYPEPDMYAGQKAKVQGFVVHSPNLPDHYFAITRFVIAHCALDAYPVGMIVKLNESRQAYAPDTWLEVRGDLMTETFNGQRELVIQARSLTPIPQPKEPYEYN